MIKDALSRDSRVQAAALFGSHARGDADRESDVDLVVFGAAQSVQDLGQLKSTIDRLVFEPAMSMSLYSIETAQLLAKDGSLFLWHIKLEGKVLFQRRKWMAFLLDGLAPYGRTKALRDLQTFRNVLGDVKLALNGTESTVLFEASTLFALVRNVGIIYSFFSGSPSFGRRAPILKLESAMGADFPFTPEDILLLEHSRLLYSRCPEKTVPNISVGWCREMSARTEETLRYVGGIVDAIAC